MRRRIALFGGSFDPIHIGHTGVARAAAEYLGAEAVIFIPAKCSPLKGCLPRAGDDDRLAMIELAIRDNDVFAVDDCELRRPAPSYTLDTVKTFQADYGLDVSIHWLLGADSVDDLVHWYRIEELLDACNVSVMVRGRYETPAFDKYVSRWGLERVRRLRENVVSTPEIDVSSTEIRERLRAGGDVSEMLEPAVADYIRKHDLYERA
jgi:nicotinate-nucleotide adenylyltransferase